MTTTVKESSYHCNYIMKNVEIYQLSKQEIEKLHLQGYLKFCPICKKYHWGENKTFPFTNVSKCPACKKVDVQ